MVAPEIDFISGLRSGQPALPLWKEDPFERSLLSGAFLNIRRKVNVLRVGRLAAVPGELIHIAPDTVRTHVEAAARTSIAEPLVTKVP